MVTSFAPTADAPALEGISGYRPLGALGSVWARLGNGRDELPVTRLSPVGLSFLCHERSPSTGELVSLVVGTGEATVGPAPALIIGLDPHPRGIRVTAMLPPGDLTHARAFAHLLASLTLRGAVAPVGTRPVEEEIIEEPERIRALLAALFASGCRASVRSLGSFERARSASLRPDHGLLLEIGQRLPVAAPFEIEVTGYYSDYRFVVEELPQRGGPLPRPRSLRRVRRRIDRRVHAPSSMQVAFNHPLWSDLRVVRRICDLSWSGLSFVTAPECDVLYPGLDLADLQLTWKRGSVLTVDAKVRHVSASIHNSGFTCGVEILRDAAGREAWQEDVEPLLYPNTRVGQPWQDDVWEVCAASGYMGLSDKQVAEFEAMRPAFYLASDKLATAPELSCQVVWPTPERVEATLSLVKPYAHSWLVYQLARYNEERPLWVSGNEVLRDLYLRGYEHSLRDRDLRWQLAYVQDAAHFSRVVHFDFPQRYADGRRACVLPFRAWELIIDDEAPPAEAGMEVGTLQPAERSLLLRAIAARRPTAYVEALDLVDERLELAGIGSQWAGHGLARERTVLVARQGEQALAAAVCELGEEGVHLFGLLDVVRVFPLRAGGEAAYALLLQHARAWYRSRGKRRLVWFEEEPGDNVPAGLGLRDLGRASLTIMARELVPDLLEHVVELTAPKSPGDDPVA